MKAPALSDDAADPAFEGTPRRAASPNAMGGCWPSRSCIARVSVALAPFHERRSARRYMIVAVIGSENVVTERLQVRHPVEADRPRFVELFCDEAFMVFSDRVISDAEAHGRFDRMLARCAEVPFAKQPIVERSSGLVIGYTGVDWIDFEGRRCLEWGYRLAPEARSKGYATEASAGLLASAVKQYTGEILGIIHPENSASKGVIERLRFQYWKRAPVLGEMRDLYRLEV